MLVGRASGSNTVTTATYPRPTRDGESAAIPKQPFRPARQTVAAPAVAPTRHGRAPDLHVNVSATRLGRPDAEAVVGDTLGRYGLPACRLVLEVTEGRRIPDLAAAVASVQRL